MKFNNIKDAAEKWNMTERRLTMLCREGKIDGAVKENGIWLIPDNALKPQDGRSIKTKQGKNKKPLPIGVSDFIRTVTDYYYVDKTEIIKDILDDLPNVSLFTRPRRFGKTLMMDMLKVFFEKADEDTSVYFKDKKIWSCGEKYRKYQGKYPVIFLTFKDVKFNSWQEAFEKIKSLFQAEYIRHKEIIISNVKADEGEIKFFNKITSMEASEVELTESLLRLSKMLHEYYGIAPIIIIDEYDTPISQGYSKGYYDEIITFMRNLFSGGFKDNSHLAFGFLTGILRVAKESIFSGMNNLIDNSMLQSRYSSYFGFTKEEVFELLKYYKKEDKMDEVCDWYDGYRFGKNEIFNPWSVISYIKNDCIPQAYWQNTGSNDIIREIVCNSSTELKEKLHSLLKGESILSEVDTSVIYPEIKDNSESIFSFLLVAGYLKVNEIIDDTSFYSLSIPNKEIKRIYNKEILLSFNDNRFKSTSSLIQEAIISKDIEAMKNHLNDYLRQTISYYDASSESFYHGLMLGLYAILNDIYEIQSNKEAGNGRFDIQMKPYKKDLPAFLIELKILATNSTDDETIKKELVNEANKALLQIKDKAYADQLEKDYNVTKVGIAFYKKQAEIVSE